MLGTIAVYFRLLNQCFSRCTTPFPGFDLNSSVTNDGDHAHQIFQLTVQNVVNVNEAINNLFNLHFSILKF